MDLHDEAFEIVRRWWRAWADKDLATLEHMLSPEYAESSSPWHFPHSGRLELIGITELMEQASRYARDVTIRNWELFDPVTKLFERTVVCSYGFRLSGERAGRRFHFRGRATDVLTKKDDEWTVVSHDGTIEQAS